MSTPLLEVRDLAFTWPRGRPVLAGIDFALERGEVLGLAGTSGAGKSTLARLLVGLLKADRGELLLDGLPMADAAGRRPRATRRRIQLVFQDPVAVFSPRRSMARSLAEPLAHFGIGSRLDRYDRIASLLARMGLDAGQLSRYPHQFSSGQRQRLAIARALLAEPDVLIADEPVAALDVSVRAQVLELLRGLRAGRALSMVVISHDLAVLRQLADRIGVLDGGRLVELAPTERLFSAPVHARTRELLAAVPRLPPRKLAAASAVRQPPTDTGTDSGL